MNEVYQRRIRLRLRRHKIREQWETCTSGAEVASPASLRAGLLHLHQPSAIEQEIVFNPGTNSEKMTGLALIISCRTVVKRKAPYFSHSKAQVRCQSTGHPSTIDTGFILTPPRLPNPATSDKAYQRILSWYLPNQVLEQIKPRLEAFGNEAISDITNELIANAERDVPYVKTRNVWGAKYPHDRLVTSSGWKELGKWGIQNGSASPCS